MVRGREAYTWSVPLTRSGISSSPAARAMKISAIEPVRSKYSGCPKSVAVWSNSPAITLRPTKNRAGISAVPMRTIGNTLRRRLATQAQYATETVLVESAACT